ncbi:MAG: hypothetical protein Q9166_004921 [cf. Caloplaca sp. 2 TL-2023]
MSYGPPPTRLVLLSDLPSCTAGEKVRFLGCVSDYTPLTGTLNLQHAYPPSLASHTRAAVDVNLLLETLNSTDIEVGEWVNVMGYVQEVEEEKGMKDIMRFGGVRGVGLGKFVKVQALVLWSAVGVKLWEYERAVEMRKNMEVLGP